MARLLTAALNPLFLIIYLYICEACNKKRAFSLHLLSPTAAGYVFLTE